MLYNTLVDVNLFRGGCSDIPLFLELYVLYISPLRYKNFDSFVV